MNIHGISPDSQKICDASDIENIWSNFCIFYNKCVQLNKVAIHLAFNGFPHQWENLGHALIFSMAAVIQNLFISCCKIASDCGN